MLHDVGKIGGSIKHAHKSVVLLSCHCSEKTLWLIENHLKFWDWVTGEMKKHQKVLDLYNHKWFHELALLGRWDKLGRNPNKKTSYDQRKIIKRFEEL